MQNSGYLKRHFPLLSSPALHGSLPLLPSAGQFSRPANAPSRFWQASQSCSYKHFLQILKDERKKQYKHRQVLEQFCDTKKMKVCCSGHCLQSYGFKSNPSTYEEAGSPVLFQSVPSFQSTISNNALRLLQWPKWSERVKTCGSSTLVATCLSLLMCSLPLCLSEDSASAQEMLQKEALGAVFIMDISQMEEKDMLTDITAQGVALAHANAVASRAVPLFTLSKDASLCKESYGVFPCSNSLPGNLFLMLVYGYLLLTAARLISEGSELLLEVMNPGLIGGLLLPILGALPDAALIFASGVGGTVEEAQQDVLVGVGVLAGSTTLILTIAWAGSVVAGRCDLSGPGETTKDLTLTRGFDLFRTGITTDEQTRWGALIMIASGAPYICAQLPLLDKHPEQGPESALAGCIIALSGLVLYCIYQIVSPWLQKKRIEEARLQFLRTSALQGISAFSENFMMPAAVSFQEHATGPSEGVLQEIFASFDKNADGKIEQDELRSLILGLNIEKGSFQDKEQVEKWFNEFDVNTDGMLSEAEFLHGIKKWATRVAEQEKTQKFQRLRNSISRSDPNFWGAKLDDAKETLSLLEAELEQNEEIAAQGEAEASVMDSSKIYKKSAIYLVSGAAMAAIFSDPLIDSIQGFSNASKIPSFFVAFVVVPFASNASELFSSLLFASKKRKRIISLTFSQIYGSVTMNNTLCLGIFLGVVYARGLTWDFSSEVTVVLLNIIIIGLIGISRNTFPLWYTIPVFSLYFVSLGGVALLDNLLGWQ